MGRDEYGELMWGGNGRKGRDQGRKRGLKYCEVQGRYTAHSLDVITECLVCTTARGLFILLSRLVLNISDSINGQKTASLVGVTGRMVRPRDTSLRI